MKDLPNVPPGDCFKQPLQYFTQPTILQQIGPRRLASLLKAFPDFNAANLIPPQVNGENNHDFSQLAARLGDTQALPEKLRTMLFALEAAASPENNNWLWRTVHQRAPGVSVSQDCPLDRALELWFVAPDELSQLTAAPGRESAPPQTVPNPTEPSPNNRSNEASAERGCPHPQPPPPLETPSNEVRENPLFNEGDVAAFARLTLLTPAQNDRARREEAKHLGIRLETLDKEVAWRRLEADYDAQANAVKVPLIEPWPEPVNGQEVLHEVRARFIRSVALPAGAPTVLALWPAHAHAFDAFLHTPRLNLTSATGECGKTTTVEILVAMSPRALRTEDLRAPVLFRLIDQHQPTLFLDELDAYLPGAEELRGLLNAGHKQGACAYRCEGRNGVRAFKAFAPAVLSGIGALPDTLRSRSIRIFLLKGQPGQITAGFDSRHTEIEKVLGRKLARWAHDNFAALQACDPPMPPGAYNRVADNWRPLFAIAHIVGGDWPALALEAYNHLTTRQSLPADSPRPVTLEEGLGERAAGEGQSEGAQKSQIALLVDIRQIFKATGATRITSKQILAALEALPDRPWQSKLATQKSKMNHLALQLHAFGIKPRALRIGDAIVRGYDLSDFTDAFSRLL